MVQISQMQPTHIFKYSKTERKVLAILPVGMLYYISKIIWSGVPTRK